MSYYDMLLYIRVTSYYDTDVTDEFEVSLYSGTRLTWAYVYMMAHNKNQNQ